MAVSNRADAEPWASVLTRVRDALQALPLAPVPSQGSSFDPVALWSSVMNYAAAVDPVRLTAVQMEAAGEWRAFWRRVWSPDGGEAAVATPVSDRRFASAAWNEPYFRTLRDGYLLASRQLKSLVESTYTGEDASTRAMLGFLVDQYLNAMAPTNFAMTNPDVIERTKETGGRNLVSGFANFLEDVAAGKGVVKRRTDDKAFTKGETIATTPGSVVFQNDLFQLIQYAPTTAEVAKEPLLYVPPLVNKYYMIDLRPKSSLVRWLVEQGRTVFVVSWVNPDERHRDCGVDDYVLKGVVEAVGAVREATGADAVDLFSFCLGGTLVALALAWLAEKGRAGEANTATLIGAMVDFSDMRDWAAFVNEAHLEALDTHLASRGYVESAELQRLFSAVRANDLIWSAVVNHYLLDQDAPPSDLLYWFEDGARIPAAFLKSYNRDLLHRNALRDPAAFKVGDTPVDLGAVETPLYVIGLKDDHVSAWSAVYDGTRLFGGPVTFVLGGSGHNAGVVNPPAANKHGYWTSPGGTQGPAEEWLKGAERHAGSWWPAWTAWLAGHGSSETVKARTPGEGPLPAIEPAPGAYAMKTYN